MDADAKGHLILQLAHDVTQCVRTRLLLRMTSKVLCETLPRTTGLRSLADVNAASRVLRTWRRRKLAGFRRPYVTLRSRRPVRNDETPVNPFFVV